MSSTTDENGLKVLVGKRRSLQSLQPISDNNRLLTRASMATSKTTSSKASLNKKLTDGKTDTKKKTDKTERITKWLTQKDSVDTDVQYWKCLAKERAKALEEALNENRVLSEANDKLTDQLSEVEHQKELLVAENQHLSRLAEEGVKLRDLLNQCIDE